MTHLLIEYETYGQTASMTHHFFQRLEGCTGKLQVRAVASGKISRREMEWSDIVMSIRSFNCISSYVAKLSRQYGRLHITVLDDNFYLLPPVGIVKVRQAELQKTLDSTDILLTSNTILSQYLCNRSQVKRCAHIDASVEADQIVEPQGNKANASGDLKLVYYSSDGTCPYFDKVILPCLAELSERIERQVQIDMIGVYQKELPSYSGCQIRFVPHMSLFDFRKQLVNGQYDIGLAPLDDADPFSQCKYFNKFIEYSMAGIPAIYTNCPPNSLVVVNGCNGVLCNNTTDAWLHAIKKMSDDPGFRRDCILGAQQRLREQFSFQNNADEIVRQIPELVSYKAPAVRMKSLLFIKVKYHIFKAYEKYNSITRVLRADGISGIIRRTKYYFLVKRNFHEEEIKNREEAKR